MSLKQSKYGLIPTGDLVFPLLKDVKEGDTFGFVGMPYKYVNPIQEFMKVFNR